MAIAKTREHAYTKGKLDFTLEGEKLQGGWILTRMRNREGDKRTNWLLIKHRDAFAREGKKEQTLGGAGCVSRLGPLDGRRSRPAKAADRKPFVTAKRVTGIGQGRMDVAPCGCDIFP